MKFDYNFTKSWVQIETKSKVSLYDSLYNVYYWWNTIVCQLIHCSLTGYQISAADNHKSCWNKLKLK